MAVTIEINEHGAILNGNPTIIDIQKIELQVNEIMKDLPKYCLYYHGLRAWVDEENGKKLLNAGAKLVK